MWRNLAVILLTIATPHQVTAEQANAVPTERTVNGKPLSADIALNATDGGSTINGKKASQTASPPWTQRETFVQSHAEGYKLSVAQGGTGASDPVNARPIWERGNPLWSGNWSSGSITAEELDAYSVYKIAFSEVGTCAIVSKNGSSIRGLGGKCCHFHHVPATIFQRHHKRKWDMGKGIFL